MPFPENAITAGNLKPTMTKFIRLSFYMMGKALTCELHVSCTVTDLVSLRPLIEGVELYLIRKYK